VFGMVGGVSQWVADCWQTTYRGAPDDGSTWEQGDCKSRGVRGGFWDGGPWYLRSARRSAMTPRNRYNYVGLRLVCAMP
jgi:formylglycine-generating enzyme required for sulfatase activity